MDLSIVIVNWNTRGLLKDCLESVERHLCGVDAEVIVAASSRDMNLYYLTRFVAGDPFIFIRTRDKASRGGGGPGRTASPARSDRGA